MACTCDPAKATLLNPGLAYTMSCQLMLVCETKKFESELRRAAPLESLASPCQQVPTGGPRSCRGSGREVLCTCVQGSLLACLACVLMLLPVTRESCRDLNAAPLVATADLRCPPSWRETPGQDRTGQGGQCTGEGTLSEINAAHPSTGRG